MKALADSSGAADRGLSACFRNAEPYRLAAEPSGAARKVVGAIVFGSDQGLVGSFNEVIVGFALSALETEAANSRVWAVGERVRARLKQAGAPLVRTFPVPNSAKAIGALVGELLVETEMRPTPDAITHLHLFYNRPTPESTCTPVALRLLPLDEGWRRNLILRSWPTTEVPEVLSGNAGSLRAFVREYLFMSLFRACTESLASENASRLATMQQADKNVELLLEELNGSLRQSRIDDELFDLISGFEALSQGRKPGQA